LNSFKVHEILLATCDLAFPATLAEARNQRVWPPRLLDLI
jgi:hypothetical protein